LSIDFEVAATWTETEIRAKIEEDLAPGWRYEFESTPDMMFRAEVFDETGQQVWAEVNQVEHLLLLNSYAWVNLRRYPPTRRLPQWANRTRLETRTPLYTDYVVGTSTKEPEDLSSNEVDSVYEKHTKS